MGLPIMYFKGFRVEFPGVWCISVLEFVLISANSADTGEMQHCDAFHLGLQCL